MLLSIQLDVQSHNRGNGRRRLYQIVYSERALVAYGAHVITHVLGFPPLLQTGFTGLAVVTGRIAEALVILGVFTLGHGLILRVEPTQ